MPALDSRLDLFTDLNEPYYTTYVREDLTSMFADEVNVCMHFLTKYNVLCAAMRFAHKLKAQLQLYALSFILNSMF